MLRRQCATCSSHENITGDPTKKEMYELAKKQSWLMRPPQPSRYKHIHGVDFADWPEKTDVACWHCCHTFDTKPIPLPTKYDEYRDIFFITGNFCSWECVKAFAIGEKKTSTEMDVMNITLMRKRSENVLTHIVPAPSRFRLKMFGGDLSIEQFRNVPSNIRHVPTVERSHHRYIRSFFTKGCGYQFLDHSKNDRNVASEEEQTLEERQKYPRIDYGIAVQNVIPKIIFHYDIECHTS